MLPLRVTTSDFDFRSSKSVTLQAASLSRYVCSYSLNSQLVRSSPFLPLVASTRRQKMASFQSLMDVEENEVCDPMPRQDINTGGCIKTRDNLSGEAASLLQD